MAIAADDFVAWIEQADIPKSRLTPEVNALLRAVFRFRQQQGWDYYSTRLLSHFLLHAGIGLKLAQIARLLGISRAAASRQHHLSSKAAIHQAHQRLAGRPHGKLLPRYAGPIAAFLLGQPNASRADVLDFIQRTFDVKVSRIALYKFLKKYGLDNVSGPTQPAASSSRAVDNAADSPQQRPAAVPLQPIPCAALAVPPAVIELASTLEPTTAAAPPFCWGRHNTPGPSC